MLEAITSCPICHSDQFDDYLECLDHFLSKETFTIQKCRQCEFLFTNPRPTSSSIIKYYKSVSYVSHSNKPNNPINYIYRLVRSYTLRQKLNILQRYILTGSLLDYGCGTGHFINYAKNKGWQVQGIEPDHDARSIASNLVGPGTVHSSLESLQQDQFSAVTLFHVLEHVHELNQTLDHLISLTADNGIFLIAVPNHRAYDAKKYGPHWAAYDVPRHLYHFDSYSMSNLANKVGLKIVAQLPMKFDSYYVSLLSEKYRNTGLYPLRGFYSGLISNRKAAKTKEYSSLIYVLQKK